MRNRPLVAGLVAISRWSKVGTIAVLVVLLTSGVLGHQYVKPFVRWLGVAVGHDELVLRALGWAWLGVPLVVIALLVSLRVRVAPRLRLVLAFTALALAASSAMLVGSRRGQSQQKVFGDVYPDAQPLGYGWGAAGLSIFAMFVVAALTYIIAGKLAGTPLPHPTHQRIGRAVIAMCVVVLLGGLWLALTGPLPN
ncbi:hypothetical protein [Kribbella yunnanensis]|uniref:hypothetical protein n=1 Tax=Kribbella yunnanensis TaxID=190194 RepID=UPI0031D67BBD